ncbi:MAG: hypothetical protein SFZ24_02605 [Planctomycetota bacterium]|nr:hypothetical protein [Planctomycetota bacterium]
MRLTLSCAVIGALTVSAPAVAQLGQVFFGDEARVISGAGTLGPAVPEPPVTWTIEGDNAAGTLTMSLLDDFTLTYPTVGGSTSIRWAGVIGVPVTSLPVRFFDMQTRGNYKIVHSGVVGGVGAPTTEITWDAFLLESPAQPRGATGIRVLEAPGSTPAFSGSGLQIFNTDYAAPTGEYFGVPGSFLALWIDAQITISVPEIDPFSPTRGVTLEAGGGFSNFRGIEARFSYETVPAPGFTGLLAAGAIIAARRRR